MKPYACHDRPEFRTRLKVQDGHFDDGHQRIPRMVAIPFVMAKDCQYTNTELGQKDPRCEACKHKFIPAVTPSIP